MRTRVPKRGGGSLGQRLTWRQLAGAAALAGIGFTIPLFIAGEAFPEPGDFAAAKIGVFLASLAASVIGLAVLYRRRAEPAIDRN